MSSLCVCVIWIFDFFKIYFVNFLHMYTRSQKVCRNISGELVNVLFPIGKQAFPLDNTANSQTHPQKLQTTFLSTRVNDKHTVLYTQ